MTEEQKRYLVIGETVYKFVRSLGWTSEQVTLLYELFCELGLQYDLPETPNSYAIAEPEPETPKAKETMPEPVPEMDIAALKKEACLAANELKAKDGKAYRTLIKQYGGRIDLIPADRLPDFITAVKGVLK